MTIVVQYEKDRPECLKKLDGFEAIWMASWDK